MSYIYFINLNGNIIKYGITNNIEERLKEHMKNHSFVQICKIYSLQISQDDEENILRNLELSFKKMSKQITIEESIEKYGLLKGETEIFEIDNYHQYLRAFYIIIETKKNAQIGSFTYNAMDDIEICDIYEKLLKHKPDNPKKHVPHVKKTKPNKLHENTSEVDEQDLFDEKIIINLDNALEESDDHIYEWNCSGNCKCVITNGCNNLCLYFVSDDLFYKTIITDIDKNAGLHNFFDMCYFNMSNKVNMCFYLESIRKNEAYIKIGDSWTLEKLDNVIKKMCIIGIKHYISFVNKYQKKFTEEELQTIMSYIEQIRTPSSVQYLDAKKHIRTQMCSKKDMMKKIRKMDEKLMLEIFS